ncbi:3-methyladenine DNA glycosylase AlkD [Neobacillus sp. B4I6]|uniref:hypothetical protein n=1 Tax=Neobacillus sp. B4I6 TaxID=3373925 RepID=UPI003D1C6F90
MTIEQKLAYIKRALELGGDVDVKFHNIRDKKAAEQVAVELSEISNRPYEQKSSNSTNWYKIQNEDYIFETYIFFDGEFLQEDVDLSGVKNMCHEIDNPMTIDSLWKEREQESKVIGECAGCEEDIVVGETFYEFTMGVVEKVYVHQNSECCMQYVAENSWCRGGEE